MYIDTHVHLNNPDLLVKVEEVISLAFEEGVQKFIVPGYDFETSKIALELAHKYPFVYASNNSKFKPTFAKSVSSSLAVLAVDLTPSP